MAMVMLLHESSGGPFYSSTPCLQEAMKKKIKVNAKSQKKSIKITMKMWFSLVLHWKNEGRGGKSSEFCWYFALCLNFSQSQHLNSPQRFLSVSILTSIHKIEIDKWIFKILPQQLYREMIDRFQRSMTILILLISYFSYQFFQLHIQNKDYHSMAIQKLSKFFQEYRSISKRYTYLII